MTAMWMLHSAVVAILLAAAALFADAALRLVNRPTRWVWAVALVLAMSVTVRNAITPPRLVDSSTQLSLPVAPTSADVKGNATLVVTSQRAASASALPAWGKAFSVPATSDIPDAFNFLAMGLSLGGFGIMLALLGAAALRLARRAKGFRQAQLLGTPVLLSNTFGPAVVGAVHPRIVLPEWVLTLPASKQRWILRHEQQHILAGDPALLRVMLLALLLAPWSIALWFMYRRLQLAVEMDCDRRVVAEGIQARPYAGLLVDVGTGEPWRLASAIGWGGAESFVTARVVQLIGRRTAFAYARAAGLCLASVAIVAAACATPTPRIETEPKPEPRIAVSNGSERSAEALLALAAVYYPDLLHDVAAIPPHGVLIGLEMRADSAIAAARLPLRSGPVPEATAALDELFPGSERARHRGMTGLSLTTKTGELRRIVITWKQNAPEDTL